eukprot:scaffold1941_cov263-Pinguiococcus_pyrenoidosus.AAC.9
MPAKHLLVPVPDPHRGGPRNRPIRSAATAPRRDPQGFPAVHRRPRRRTIRARCVGTGRAALRTDAKVPGRVSSFSFSLSRLSPLCGGAAASDAVVEHGAAFYGSIIARFRIGHKFTAKNPALQLKGSHLDQLNPDGSKQQLYAESDRLQQANGQRCHSSIKLRTNQASLEQKRSSPLARPGSYADREGTEAAKDGGRRTAALSAQKAILGLFPSTS